METAVATRHEKSLDFNSYQIKLSLSWNFLTTKLFGESIKHFLLLY